MSSILLFSDIHSDLQSLQSLMDLDADAYIAAGDLVNWAKGLDKVGPVMQRRAGKTYVIPGNHESECDITQFAQTYGFAAPHGQVIEIASRSVGFLGYSNRTPFDTPGEYTEDEIARRLVPLVGCEVLVCHCPPFGTALDQAAPGKHFGSRAIAEHIKRNQPEWFFCGHIHEAAGVETTLGKTRARNLGKRGYLLRV
ncbi:MAG: metallophosphoesterase [Bryobacteraceae bacterium]|nr:metallophosphoesterase [Bryobacteraceae bacterium]